MGAVLSIAFDFVAFVCVQVYEFAKWFYLTFLPFVIQYLGLPLFFLGILLAIAFAGGTVLLTMVFFIFMYYFIKGTLLDTKPINLKKLL
jgi:hypothetical protein